jgi:hypothetical protein
MMDGANAEFEVQRIAVLYADVFMFHSSAEDWSLRRLPLIRTMGA